MKNKVCFKNFNDDIYVEHLNSLYQQALSSFRDHNGKSIKISYNQRCRFVALSHQVLYGPFSIDKAEPLGLFDIIGKDRRIAWMNLEDMSKEEAMKNFIYEISKAIPNYLDTQLEFKKFKQDRSDFLMFEPYNIGNASFKSAKLADTILNCQKRQCKQIQEALTKQNFSHFEFYAKQQFPDDLNQQKLLTSNMQNQLINQYMQRISDEQMGRNKEEFDLNCDGNYSINETKQVNPPLLQNKKEINEFKMKIKTSKESIMKIGHGETVTIRVPTHSDGCSLIWEFATDSYDIGFGLYFEWLKSDEENEVSIHVSESEDEYLEDEYEDFSDPEIGSSSNQLDKSPPTSIIIPIYRRDSQKSVCVGTHNYPGQGVYLLKFDNSYSLWRSKTLYYRIYYAK